MRPRHRTRTPAAAAGALAALVAFAAPSGASNQVSTSGSTVRIRVPVAVTGAMSAEDAVAALERQAAPLLRERLYGCFGVDAAFEAAAAGGDEGGEDAGGDPAGEAHELTVLAQRPGQFLRPSGAGSADPFEGARELHLGGEAFRPGSVLDGAVRLLLVQAGSGGQTVPSLIDSIIRHTDTTYLLKPCRWSGTLDVTTVYDPYGLTISTSVEFSFTVDPTGFLEGTVAESTRQATSEDDDVGSCSGSGLEMFRIGLSGQGQTGTFELRFEPKGAEPDFTLSCSRGRVDIGGDFIRAAFLPTGRLELGLRARDGATATHSATLQGRKVTAKVTIRRG